MPKFSLEKTMPCCLATKDLISSLEQYLNVEVRQKLGDSVGETSSYRISITEDIGTETLATINDYAPHLFSDATKQIIIRWDNGYKPTLQLDIGIRFDGTFLSFSTLSVTCTGATARETAITIDGAIRRLIATHRTYNWFFNPLEFPLVSVLAGIGVFVFLQFGFLTLPNNRQHALYLFSGAVLTGWILLSSIYFKRRISFDTRRQQLLDRTWKYFSVGTFGFILFGTLLPLLRRALIGF